MYVSFVDHLAPSLTFFHLQWYEDSLTYLKHMPRAQYLVISDFLLHCLHKFVCVHQEPQQTYDKGSSKLV